MLKTPDVVRSNRLTQVNIGQGEGETRWKGWPWNTLRFKFDIINKCVPYSVKPSC